MASFNPGAAGSAQTPSVSAAGNLSQEWIILLTPGVTTSITAASSVEISLTISGLLPFDFVEVNKLNHVAGLSIGNARVSAANTLAVQMVNSTAGAISLLTTDQYLVSIERPIAQQVTNGLPTAIPSMS